MPRLIIIFAYQIKTFLIYNKMKRLMYVLCFVLISVVAHGQAKYVFYFIGDGMGVNQVNGTEMYRAELQNGRIGVEPLLFTQFPVGTMASTFSATNCYQCKYRPCYSGCFLCASTQPQYVL